MYKDAGYGENWQPTTNNVARRIDPYTRVWAILGCFFVVGFALIVIVILSLIPVYLSRGTSATNYVQVSKVYINGYILRFRSPSGNFNVDSILSQATNRQALRAALTALIQRDPSLAGSVVDIVGSTLSSKRKRQQTSDLMFINSDLYITSNKPCAAALCLNQFQTRVTKQLSNKNRTTINNVYYEEPITNGNQKQPLQVYWLAFELPSDIKSNVSFALTDLKALSSSLTTLMNVDKNKNQSPPNETITSTLSILA